MKDLLNERWYCGKLLSSLLLTLIKDPQLEKLYETAVKVVNQIRVPLKCGKIKV